MDSHRASGFDRNFDLKGAVAGGTLGYNLQTGAWVWGIEGDFDYSWIKGTDTTTCGGPGCETQNNWLPTGRLRVGYAWDRLLPYITGGAAGGNIKLGGGGLGTESKTKIGWTAGAGLEYAFLGAWSAKLEYLYVDLGGAECDAATCGGATIDGSFKTSLVRVGVNYRFSAGLLRSRLRRARTRWRCCRKIELSAEFDRMSD